LEREDLFLETCQTISELWVKLDHCPSSELDSFIEGVLKVAKTRKSEEGRIAFPLLPPISNLGDASLHHLKQYIAELRVSHLGKVKESIQALWKELNIPSDEQIEIKWDGSWTDMDVERVSAKTVDPFGLG
jgi:hypothetical protein